ncbi:MAG: iron-sulfur cluster assembly scaffold protein [Nanoarchaeota archaeon]|nr:iron-sulfur cluster assembly scaffold protein [Nanoarchaeota archaeon]
MPDYNDKEEQNFYLEQLMDNYKNPQNFGELKNYTFFKHQKNASCGDTFDIYVKLDEKNEKIVDVKFKGEGCAISTASMSLLSQELTNMDYTKAKTLTDKDIYDLIGIKITPSRINCALLSLKAFKNGVLEFEKKND